MKNSLVSLIAVSLAVSAAPYARALDVKLIGPAGNALAPNTEYGFAIWICNPQALADDGSPELRFIASGGTVTRFCNGVFERNDLDVSTGALVWTSAKLPNRQGLIAFVSVTTGASGQLTLSLTGQILLFGWPVTGSDQKTYSIVAVTGDAWSGFRDLANSRAATNSQFAMLYTSLLDWPGAGPKAIPRLRLETQLPRSRLAA